MESSDSPLALPHLVRLAILAIRSLCEGLQKDGPMEEIRAPFGDGKHSHLKKAHVSP